MRLGEVVANAGRLVRGSPETEISSIAYDSRRVKPGALFCALAGVQADGARFVSDALARGAVAVLSSELLEGDFPLVVVPEARRGMALVAAHFHRMPASRMSVLGVTGTNGKTTTAYLVDAMVAAAGRRGGLIGTVEQRFGGVRREATHTTPESVELQGLFAEMATAGTEIVVMEVSSHALAQHRVDGVRFRAAAFTNLTRDHLDYHGSMDEYFSAKSLLFQEHLASGGVAVLNGALPATRALAETLRASGRTVWRFGVSSEESFELGARDLTLSLGGIDGELLTPMGVRRFHSPLVGAHNLENILAATGLALAAGIPLGAVVDALSTSSGAPGRLEPVPDAQGRRIFVDYAHTDDALRRVLSALRSVAPKGAKIITVFGCGGDRDRGKRPLMGRAAGEGSDMVVVTSDNPRTENPGAILTEILPGVEASGVSRYELIEAREEAIARAVELAAPGDVVLIAGKGHEDYQIVGTEKRSFDDRLVAREALRKVNS